MLADHRDGLLSSRQLYCLLCSEPKNISNVSVAGLFVRGSHRSKAEILPYCFFIISSREVHVSTSQKMSKPRASNT